MIRADARRSRALQSVGIELCQPDRSSRAPRERARPPPSPVTRDRVRRYFEAAFSFFFFCFSLMLSFGLLVVFFFSWPLGMAHFSLRTSERIAIALLRRYGCAQSRGQPRFRPTAMRKPPKRVR